MATNGEQWRKQVCRRCGQLYQGCKHLNTMAVIEPDEAARIQARYELGRRFNPDHDTASYRDPAPSQTDR